MPQLRDGRLRLLACTPDRLRLTGEEWLAQYTLAVAEPGGEPREVVLAGTLWPPGRDPSAPGADPADAGFGEPGWRCALPDPRLDLRLRPSGDALPALRRLTDPMEVSRLLEPILRQAGYGAVAITSCDPVVARYKESTRCTVVVHVSYAERTAGPVPPDRVVLKTYEGGGLGEAAWEAMNVLWAHPRAWAHAVRLAEPLGHLADERILVQGPVPGDRTLKERARRAIADGRPEQLGRLRADLAATARALAAIHTSGTSYGRTATLGDELDNVREVVDRLAASMPDLARAAQPLLYRLDELARGTRPDPAVSSHHTFRPNQVLLDGEGVGFIDFDGACMAEPALDIGRFRGTLRNIGISARGLDGRRSRAEVADATLALLDDLCEGFLGEYLRYAAVSRDRVVICETCDLLLTMLHAWTKVSLARVEPRLTVLLHQIRTGGLERDR